MLRENEDSPLKKTHWGATRALSGFGPSTRFLKVKPSGLKMFEDRNEEIIENVCVCVLWTLPTLSDAHVASWDIETFLPSSIAIENPENRIIALLCNSALHTAEASPIFFCEVTSAQNKKNENSMKQLMKHNI